MLIEGCPGVRQPDIAWVTDSIVHSCVVSLLRCCLLWCHMGGYEELSLLKALRLPLQVQLLGQSISVGRPSGYVDPSRATCRRWRPSSSRPTSASPPALLLPCPALQLQVRQPPHKAGTFSSGSCKAQGLQEESALKRDVWSRCQPCLHSRCEVCLAQTC